MGEVYLFRLQYQRMKKSHQLLGPPLSLELLWLRVFHTVTSSDGQSSTPNPLLSTKTSPAGILRQSPQFSWCSSYRSANATSAHGTNLLAVNFNWEVCSGPFIHPHDHSALGIDPSLTSPGNEIVSRFVEMHKSCGRGVLNPSETPFRSLPSTPPSCQFVTNHGEIPQPKPRKAVQLRGQ